MLGYVVGVLFYALLALAALTSTISMHEIGTSLFFEELHVSRKKGAILETIIAILIGIACSLSCGAVEITVLGKTFLNFCDFLTSNVLLPLGSFATCILVGWVAPQKLVKDEFTNCGTVSVAVYKVWLFLVRFVSPLCIAIVFLHQLGLF